MDGDHPTELLARLGAVATRSQLIAGLGRRGAEELIAEGGVEKVARGRYAASSAGEAARTAIRLSGTVCLLDAALLHGWPVRLAPTRPQVCVPRNRRLSAGAARGVDLRRFDLGPDDRQGRVTSPERTLLDCARHLPLADSLPVLDSALREGFSPARLARMAADARGPGGRAVRRAVGLASEDKANPFESALHALASEVSGLSVRPQVPLWAEEFLGAPDLVDETLRIVLEADSFEWHGGRAALAADARRYNRMVVRGWLVLRFAWEDVMFDPEYVLEVLRMAVEERTYGGCPACGAA